MKRIIALICSVFVLLSSTVNAAYTGSEIYNLMENTFLWLYEDVSPLGDTDSIAADYYVMALNRVGKAFDYGKYIKITNSKTPTTNADALRIIISSTACGGRVSDKFLTANTYNAELDGASDIADALIAILGGEYKVKSHTDDVNRLAVRLLSMQNDDGRIGENVLSTSKSIIALSFLSGNCYIEKGGNIGEKYRYDVNSAILRAVNYLQNNKSEDFGFGNTQNTAYAVMALDSAGVDADNDPGFSDGEKSTLKSLIESSKDNGKIGKSDTDTAIGVCALVSHLRAMQGNSPFFALLTEDMPYNPDEYIDDINRSGEGLKIETQNEIEVIAKSKISTDTTEKTYELSDMPPIDAETGNVVKKPIRALQVIIIGVSFLIIISIAVWFVVYMLNVKSIRKFHTKEPNDDDDDDSLTK